MGCHILYALCQWPHLISPICLGSQHQVFDLVVADGSWAIQFHTVYQQELVALCSGSCISPDLDDSYSVGDQLMQCFVWVSQKQTIEFQLIISRTPALCITSILHGLRIRWRWFVILPLMEKSLGSVLSMRPWSLHQEPCFAVYRSGLGTSGRLQIICSGGFPKFWIVCTYYYFLMNWGTDPPGNCFSPHAKWHK